MKSKCTVCNLNICRDPKNNRPSCRDLVQSQKILNPARIESGNSKTSHRAVGSAQNPYHLLSSHHHPQLVKILNILPSATLLQALKMLRRRLFRHPPSHFLPLIILEMSRPSHLQFLKETMKTLPPALCR